ncbi:NF-kappa-B essential modulator isoform X2 [Narcine bancroftii]|uniref:NF-kappa-B essential modulator isoform X2 n=1 Tax=Narcine bancroftii TaxID=1343680 RepID=UPI003832084B
MQPFHSSRRKLSQLKSAEVPGSPITAMVQSSDPAEGDPEAEASDRPLTPRPGGTPLAIPADLCALETLIQSNRQLQNENAGLREAIRQSNQALRDRCQDLQDFHSRNQKEKEFVTCRFHEARRLVEHLRAVNGELWRRLGEEGMDQKGPTSGSQPRTSVESSLASYSTLTQSMFNCSAIQPAEDHGAQDGGEYVHLLKARKEELEDDLQVLRAENQELRLQLVQEQQKDQQHEAVPELAKQMPVRNPDVQDCSTEVEKHQAQLEKRWKKQEAQFEAKIQGLTRQVEQLSDDRMSLKAQVTSLLAELRDSQSNVESITKQCTALEGRCQVLEERRRNQEKVAETQRKQSSITIDQLRIDIQNSESALKTERQGASEDKRKLAQLQVAYHQLFAEYDTMVKEGRQNRGHADDIGEQLREAESALALKQDLIDKLKDEAESMKTELETIPVLKAQAEVFKADFLVERAAREKLHELKEAQQERLRAVELELERLRGEQEVAMRAHIEELQRRHSDSLRGHMGGTGNFFPNGSTVPFSVPADLPPGHGFAHDVPDYRCPKCQYQAPDMDTLQIHVMDCIQ